jgi:hypothetical protein
MLSACKILEAAFLDFDGDCGAELEGGNGRAYRSGEKAWRGGKEMRKVKGGR